MSSPFCTAVRKAMGDLVLKHGFQVIERGRSLLTFETNKVELALSYDDQRSFEVSIGVRLKPNSAEPAYSFDELLRIQNVPANEWSTGYAARNVEATEMIIQRIVDILDRHAAPLLDADPDAWARLDEQRRSDCIAYASTTRMAHAKWVADEAWVAKDYRKVVATLEAVESELDQTNAAKLAYAKRAISP
jgi:hypothetical protein